MSTLTRYILKEMVGPTSLGFGFYTSIILMKTLFDMAELIIRKSLTGAAVGRLLLFSLPNIVVLTIPMSLLFGILIAVGRLSSDSEIVAMRALGISTRTIYRPVFFFSAVMFLLNLYLINYVMPQGNRQFVSLRAELMTAAAEKIVKPRVFFDQFDNLMIFVDDVDERTGEWKGVFLADSRTDGTADPTTPREMGQSLTAPDDQQDAAALSGAGSGQRIVVARTGDMSVVGPRKDIWLNLRGAETHIWDPGKPDRYDHTRNETQRIRLPSEGGFDTSSLARSFKEMSLQELIAQDRRLGRSRDENDRINRNVARVEIHKKFASPFACIAFGVLGLPLGITNRRGGKSSGFSLSIAIIVFYYVMINNGEQLAVAGKIPAGLGMWAANLILLAAGIVLLRRANRDFVSGRGESGMFARGFRALGRLIPGRRSEAGAEQEDRPSLLSRLDVTFPNILDRYVLREFLKVLILVLISVIALFMVIDYTDTSQEAQQNGIAAAVVIAYYRFQMFTILNWTLPISVLVATLVTFALLSKNNEVTAMKSSGVSLYRLGLPILGIAAILSVFAYFVLDFVLPYSTERADQLRRQIRGKKTVASATQQKLWYLGRNRYILNFLGYNKNREMLTQVQVFELHPTEFRLTRRVYANRATWNGSAWVFEDGWVRSFLDDGTSTFTPINKPLALHYAETPEDFATDVKPPDQMTYAQLRRYIEVLRGSGYAADELAVRLYEKTSWPMISIIMALIAMPFAFRMGKRGALYGVGLALIIGILYWVIFAVFTQFGAVGNLPPLLAAWAANILFAIGAIYMFLHVET